MTDLKKFKDLMKDFGIEFHEKKYDHETKQGINRKHILFLAGEQKVSGYPGFNAAFIFSDKGDFIEMDIGE